MVGESVTDPLRRQALAALSRGHHLFAGDTTVPTIDAPDRLAPPPRHLGLPAQAAARSDAAVARLRRLVDTDRALAHIAASARTEHTDAKAATRTLLDAAHADITPAADTPLGAREASARMAARLRAQHRHIAKTHRRAQLLAMRLRRLRYRHRQAMHDDHAATGHEAVAAAIRKALDIKGIHDPVARARWTRGMDLVARRESNYDADAVNGWDSNAARGTPSKGAWQFIAPTFAAYHEPGTSSNIHDLVAQACAFINYARGRYGVAADASDLAHKIQQADPRRSPKGY